MSSGTGKPGTPSKPGPGGFSAAAPTSQAILLDKLARRSTPDSEALASSDDEGDALRQESAPAPPQPQKPIRRASWLNDTSQQVAPPKRKGSFASASMSPTTSHPSAPASDLNTTAWGSPSGVLARGHSGSGTFAWGVPNYWNDRKEPPARLSEVLPSPTSAVPPGGSSSSFFGDVGHTQTSPAPREDQRSVPFPIPIPLEPQLKNYRSQSYSVGQLEPGETIPSLIAPSVVGARVRTIPHSGLQHRPSRPSMLSEMANDSSVLGKVDEDEDVDSTDSLQGSQHQEQAKATIEMLTRENMLLRQQQQYQNARLRPRASTSSYNLSSMHEPVPEESDYAIDELEEGTEGSDFARRGIARRMSEFGVGPYRTPYLIENRKLENVKNAAWQSSLGFGGLADMPQSRRHSFANVPTRQASISSLGEAAHEQASQDLSHSQEFGTVYQDGSNYGTASQGSSYMLGNNNLATAQQGMGQAAYGMTYQPPYNNAAVNYPNRTISPPRQMYGLSQPRHNQSLYIVTFKCSRADVFYIQEGTGLSVAPGDLVIVEADRGTDLGTVSRDKLDWQSAKEWKETYAEEHYKWLMMYSQNAAAAQDGAGAGLMAASNGLQGSAVGGMGPPNQHHMQEASSGELKPKLIKRLAQPHEISALRDKEGNEAKAKRVCQTKVKEHGLNMEILDAEFQMDWKKLTFYYFADSYINFNSLVTDLFKIYKTRIWMSAINPASFASPTLGLQAPSGIGPGALIGRAAGPTAGRRQDAQQDNHPPYSGTAQAARGAQLPIPMPFGPDRAVAPAPNYPIANYAYNNQYAGGFANAARPGGMPYASGMISGLDAYGGTFPQGDFAGRGRFPASQATAAPQQHDQNGPSLDGPPAGWINSFQGLSLNSR
ncbi:hypothetical protein QBC44DRAFT_81536 [Cladorrhinum sp. PSN332]|nr:hypothetical protein QBC44DRAFT_81536 [Cladorrhinum sp. PSN332]